MAVSDILVDILRLPAEERARLAVELIAASMANPIRALTEASTTAGPEVTKINPPEREYDGRRCRVHFTPAAGAKTYDVWVSPYADGRGAILLGKDWIAPGQLLTGLSPNIDLYLFVVSKDAAGKSSREAGGCGFLVKTWCFRSPGPNNIVRVTKASDLPRNR